ncbi:hypothetical protein MJG53_008020 [Ovis ammon polii x Ovis aries]|uniref:Uncharacterized protein n=1 Tax=Ovis ammon polii x Ovis aries TaxID=2918886 RepID=A0ACB9UZ99_9CETA|nr:hypothetical protein MJG53_008020 [Ovis ammon polii x Ovis aries]
MGFVALWHMDQGLKPMSPALTEFKQQLTELNCSRLVAKGICRTCVTEGHLFWIPCASNSDVNSVGGPLELSSEPSPALQMRPERSRAGSCSSQHTQGQKGPSTEEVPPTHAECVVVSEQRLNISVFDSEKGNWKSLHDYPRFTDTPKSQERKPENGRGKAGSGAEMELEGMAGEGSSAGAKVTYGPVCRGGLSRPETDFITSLGPPKANSQQPTRSCCALSHIRNS